MGACSSTKSSIYAWTDGENLLSNKRANFQDASSPRLYFSQAIMIHCSIRQSFLTIKVSTNYQLGKKFVSINRKITAKDNGQHPKRSSSFAFTIRDFIYCMYT